MYRLFLAEDLEGRLDCYGGFKCHDRICAAHCALNTSCATVKARFAAIQTLEDEEAILSKTRELDF
jgi:hypothetical protein